MKQFPSRKPLALALLAALSAVSLPALANDECGTATTGKVECTTDAPQVKYEGVEDLEVVIKGGVTIDASQLPEAEHAVVVMGDGDITLTAEEGSVISAHGLAYGGVEIGSTSGNVNVTVDQVFGGNFGLSAVAGGDVDIEANVVSGDVGVQGYSTGGDVDIHVKGTAYGYDMGAAVYGVADRGDVTLAANRAVSEGFLATGLWGTSHDGSVSIDADTVVALGSFSTGILGESFATGDVNIGVNFVSVEGMGAVGILAVAVDGEINVDAGFVAKSDDTEGGAGIAVFAVNNGANVRADTVIARGNYAGGIDMQTDANSETGAGANLEVGYVATDGLGAHGINIESAGAVNVKVTTGIDTFQGDSYGIYAISNWDIHLDVQNVNTFGALSSAVWAEAGFDGDVNARVKDIWMRDGQNEWFAVGLNAKEGDVKVLAEGTIHAENGYAITNLSQSGTSHIQVARGASVYGGTTALDAATGGGARFDVLGRIDSGTGPVIRALGTEGGGMGAADVRVGSTGEVHGYVQLTDKADTIGNAGKWYADGVSTFGAGDDAFRNGGHVALDGPATTMGFSGLERFENAGRVSLANGRTGDAFNLDGTLVGAGGTIGLDLDLATHEADMVNVGAISGVNVIDLDVEGRGSGLGLSDVVVASAEGGDGQFVLSQDSAYRGFVGFSLRQAGGEWLLESDLADEAYLAAAVPAGVRDLWRQGAQSVATHLAATHGGEGTDGPWMQAVGGDFDGTSSLSHARGATELEWHGSHEGAQAGFEFSFGHWRTGITGGFGEASMDLGGNEETTLDSVNAGVYARYDNGGWFAGGLVRAERVDVETKWGSIGLNAKGDGSVVGFELDGGYHFDLGAAYLEPAIRVSSVDVSLPDQLGTGGTVRWEDAAMGTAEIGVRLGATEGWKGWRPYASASFAREFGDADETIYDLGAETVRVGDAGERSFGRVAGGVEYSLGRFDLYGEVEARVGDMEGTTGRFGARVRF